MDALIANNSVALGDADGPPATGTPQYATSGTPGTQLATEFPAYHYNGLIQELLAIITAAGETPSRFTLTQLLTSIQTLIANQGGNLFYYAGNPNGHVTGQAGTPGINAPDRVCDGVNKVVWICTAAGNANWQIEVSVAYVAAGGSTNAWTGTFLADLPTLSNSAGDGTTVQVKFPNTNSAASPTFNGATIYTPDATTLPAGALPLYAILQWSTGANGWICLNGAIPITPPTTVVGDIATWGNTTGSELNDSSVAVSSLAPKASPTLTGTPAAPTASLGTNTTQLATTAFVAAAVAPLAPLASPTLTGTPAAPTASLGTNTTQVATTAFVQETVGAPSYPIVAASAVIEFVYNASGTGQVGGAGLFNITSITPTNPVTEITIAFTNPIITTGYTTTGSLGGTADIPWSISSLCVVSSPATGAVLPAPYLMSISTTGCVIGLPNTLTNNISYQFSLLVYGCA